VHKDVKGLEQTLNSIMLQTLPQTLYEIIVCNDGGDKHISEVCRKFTVQDICIIPIQGSYNACNEGIEESAGEYIAFVDADINVPERWLELGVEALKTSDYVGGPVFIQKEQTVTPAKYHESVASFKGNEPGNRHNFFITANLFVKCLLINLK
jgi:cellulose synthase/poly-beta-1,6-N-acetylglucosamine synthase-like glycosyltransferase